MFGSEMMITISNVKICHVSGKLLRSERAPAINCVENKNENVVVPFKYQKRRKNNAAGQVENSRTGKFN